VTFAGYKSPHPLLAKIELRVGTDGSITPKDAVARVCAEILKDLDHMNQVFAREVALAKADKEEREIMRQREEMEGRDGM
jgi:DNA-directed RNA polymerase II subunit RPB11